ncbi:hypothetical protein Mpt1_c03380 [Candidatus Methanoplasma termitum]|uniref:Uncharacterized protein n=1 Tax=Candidatus Methanoplasma termitum TaxID=1577791 RepID=A0A0A7LAY3_9ARCH|nr:hypothetical protein [Candidatus Methanoplasma termitum]AIZ56234.1 hypothetical protein Mpt1_c03380 [Candidatus Methanoplasma termitum]MCL2334378.1 hypothetical protein [Candidatus Methanoplasma sp.]
MSNENYQKCRTCRFCIHSRDSWVCSLRGSPTHDDGTCERYRPGSCENCNNIILTKSKAVCRVTVEETDVLNVCSDYDPSGRRSV